MDHCSGQMIGRFLFNVRNRRNKDVVKRGWHIMLLLFLVVHLSGCGGGKQSSVEGKLVDWNGKPVAGVKITATQMDLLIKGYEKFETVTRTDGSFRIDGLYPDSYYKLEPSSDKWTCETMAGVTTAPQGETRTLRDPLQIAGAYAINGSQVFDLATGSTSRFIVSAEGVIMDGLTGLEWVEGPDKDIDYDQAEKWVAACSLGGGGWRMPTNVELYTLYEPNFFGVMNKVFKTTDAGSVGVWGEPSDSEDADVISFYGKGGASQFAMSRSFKCRVLGVRSHPL